MNALPSGRAHLVTLADASVFYETIRTPAAGRGSCAQGCRRKFTCARCGYERTTKTLTCPHAHVCAAKETSSDPEGQSSSPGCRRFMNKTSWTSQTCDRPELGREMFQAILRTIKNVSFQDVCQLFAPSWTLAIASPPPL